MGVECEGAWKILFDFQMKPDSAPPDNSSGGENPDSISAYSPEDINSHHLKRNFCGFLGGFFISCFAGMVV